MTFFASMRRMLPLLLIGLTAQGPALSLRHPTVVAAMIASAFTVLSLSALILLWRSKRARHMRGGEAGAEQVKLARRLEVAEALLRRDAALIAVWEEPGGMPQRLWSGLDAGMGVPDGADRFMLLDTWLSDESRGELEAGLDALWHDGKVFSLTLLTKAGQRLEAQGLHTSSSAILTLRPLAMASDAATTPAALLRGLLETVPYPVWLRHEETGLLWQNASFAGACLTAGEAQTRNLSDAVKLQTGSWQSGKTWHQRLPLKLGKEQRRFEVSLLREGRTIAGLAVDLSEFDADYRDRENVAAAQQEAVKHLHAGIAIFGADQRLRYANAAWRELWQFDETFLAEKPDEEAILDRLRAKRLLPEEKNFTAWKKEFLSRSRTGQYDTKWYLPNGRVIRIASLLSVDSGHTLICENLSEIEELRAHFSSNQRTQRETFEALTDGVAVFGSNGRLQMFNPAFAALWHIEQAGFIDRHPHIDDIVRWFGDIHRDEALWSRLKACIHALGEDRTLMKERFTRGDGKAIDLSCKPLPGGSTLVTFIDRTASVAAENALMERNKALEASDRLKNDFIQHISYELRSPLTNIIGFTEVLADPSLVGQPPAQAPGGLPGDKQHEYIGYIREQSQTLLAIIDDILTLATVDAGVMTLDVTRVEPLEVMKQAAAALRRRASEQGVTLAVETNETVAPFNADEQRVRQVLYNLLSNAIGFSQPGQTVTLSVSADAAGGVVFTVRDEGPGIASDDLPRVFDRFATKANGTDHRGVGLGLSLVKAFVELHGGTITLRSTPGQGTSAICIFPARAVEQHRLEQHTV